MFKRGSNKLHTHTFEVYIKKGMKLHGSKTAEHIITVAYVEEIGIVQSRKREAYRSGYFLCLVTSSPTLFFQSLCRTVHVLHHTIELQFWSNRRGGSAPPHTPCKTSLSNDIEHNLTHSVPATIADDACFFEEFGAPGMGFGDPKSLRIDACSNSHSHDLFCIWRESGCS